MTFATLISPAEVAARIDDPNWAIVDCRFALVEPAKGRRDYLAAHIPGAIYAHLDEDLSGSVVPGRSGRHPLPAVDAFVATLSAWGIGDGVQVVVYDDAGGVYAGRLWWMLRWLGFESVAVLDGGFAKWTTEGRPVSIEPGAPVPAAFRIAHVTPTVSATGIMNSIPRHALVIVDARSPERFRGETEPLDPVAGHIPGARNRPNGQNLNADGTFKDPAFLRAEFGAVLGDDSPDLVVHSCGSGVSACHNILAMEIAGMPGTRLYPGSWSEWCADPERPVARGGSK